MVCRLYPTFSCGHDTYYAFMNFLEDNAFYLSAVCTLFYVLCAVECPWRIIVLKYSYGIEIYVSCSSGIWKEANIFLQVMPCITVDVHQHFKGICWFHHLGRPTAFKGTLLSWLAGRPSRSYPDILEVGIPAFYGADYIALHRRGLVLIDHLRFIIRTWEVWVHKIKFIFIHLTKTANQNLGP